MKKLNALHTPADAPHERNGFPFARVEACMKEAVRLAIADHHRAGNPVAIWRDGQIVMLHPDGSVQPVNGQEPVAASEEPRSES